MKSIEQLSNFIDKYFYYRNDRISLISSENISSKLLRSTYSMGLSDQYCSRLPENRKILDNLSFGHISLLDDLNEMTRNIVMEIFHAKECDIRPISGLSSLNILLFSLLENHDNLFRMYDLHGGHLSTNPIAKRLNIRSFEMRLGKDYRLDTDLLAKMVKENKPKVIFLDSSYILFPYPLQKIRDISGKDTIIVYDASHVIALLNCKTFRQSPFAQGVDIIQSTTHKTLWGPQKAMLLFKEKSEISEKVIDVVKDLVSNTHMHHILALSIAMLEYKKYGEYYAHKIVENSRKMASYLDELGLDIVAKDFGFTESNQFWVNFVTKENAIYQFQKLEKANISSNVIFLPKNRWGWRIGVNEITRLGFEDDHIKELARNISDLVLERKPISTVKQNIVDLKKSFHDVKFSFDNTEAAKNAIDKIYENFLKIKVGVGNKYAKLRV